jgi:3-deoxy-7-phosphoheptulonate synthase
MSQVLNDRRISQTLPLITPAELKEGLPLTSLHANVVAQGRQTITNILDGKDERLLVIVGPCSVHDPKACIEYAEKLSELKDRHPKLYIVMRVYFEKPRTIIGWKGLINDPSLDGQYKINEGITLARELLLEVTALGLPVATEFLDTTFGQYYADLISFGAIGARTVESQIHRELASGLSMPVGFKNRTDGEINVALDAIRSAAHGHSFPSLSEQGNPVIYTTTGNEDACLILRGGNKTGTNFHEDDIRPIAEQQLALGINKKIIVDCSHGNSQKDHNKQAIVAEEITRQRETGFTAVGGIMLESFLIAGRQDIAPLSELVYGQSITDACISLDETEVLFQQLS